MSKIVLGTSLSPNNIEKQIYAIKTWIANGFEVISCNTSNEIKILKPLFEEIDIKFEEVERDAREFVGKPLPYIQDILLIVGEKTEKICGFCNSDIIMPLFDDGMYQYIIDEVDRCLMYTHRYEVKEYDDIQKMNWKIHIDGIDLFFVDKDLIDDFYDDGFFVQSAWDLCLLTKCKLRNIEVKELVNPIAFHLSHPISWNLNAYDVPIKNFWYKYFSDNCNVHDDMLMCYYEAIFSRCVQSCYLNNMQEKCLIVIGKSLRNEKVMESIYAQDYPDICIAETDKEKCKFDIIIYMKEATILNKAFCKSVIYLMREYSCNKLWLGRFFSSKINGKCVYNELNRNMSLLEEINDTCDLHILVENNKKNGIERKILIPIIHEELDIFNENIIRPILFPDNIYIMPRGIRGIERYHVYKDKLLGSKICGFIDNAPDKWGEQVDEMNTYSLRQLQEVQDEISVIISSKYYNKEIEQQLLQQKGISKIYNSSCILWIDEDGTGYYFDLQKYKKFVMNQKN